MRDRLRGSGRHLLLPAILIFLLWTSACRSSREAGAVEPVSSPAPVQEIDSAIPGDPAMETLVAPYREALIDEVSEVIGEATAAILEDRPEGPLGNLAADAMLAAAREAVEEPVHCAVANNGGLRVPLLEGPITVGRVYELMPFENWLTVLELDATGVDSLFQQIARAGGEPVAGCSFSIESDTDRAVNGRVAGEPILAGETYRIVTSDYLANGGGSMPALWEPVSREDLPILHRDALITYIERLGHISPREEGRITYIDSD